MHQQVVLLHHFWVNVNYLTEKGEILYSGSAIKDYSLGFHASSMVFFSSLTSQS
jgi:hypothetical protein